MIFLELTHSTEDSGVVKHKVELGLLWDLARSLRCLKSEGSELREEKSETWIVVVRIPNHRHGEVDAGLKVFERGLSRM